MLTTCCEHPQKLLLEFFDICSNYSIAWHDDADALLPLLSSKEKSWKIYLQHGPQCRVVCLCALNEQPLATPSMRVRVSIFGIAAAAVALRVQMCVLRPTVAIKRCHFASITMSAMLCIVALIKIDCELLCKRQHGGAARTWHVVCLISQRNTRKSMNYQWRRFPSSPAVNMRAFWLPRRKAEETFSKFSKFISIKCPHIHGLVKNINFNWKRSSAAKIAGAWNMPLFGLPSNP